MALKQDSQFIKLGTPLGDDVLVIQRFAGVEAVSRTFKFEIIALSEQDGIDETKLIGKAVTVSINTSDGEIRYFNGIVTRFGTGPMLDGRYREYKMVIEPWFQLLNYRSDCRIFQEKTAKDIIESIFSDLGFTDYQWKLQGSPASRTYCVQYRESDFNFVCRLLEEEGIFYYFKHENGTHTLVLCDYVKGYDSVPADAIDVTDGTHGDFSINSWQREYNFRSGKVSHTDYNFLTPSTSLLSDQKTVLKLSNSAPFEVYDFPGEYEEKSIGDFYALNRMEAIEAAYTEVVAGSDYSQMCAGFTFTVGRHHLEKDAKKNFVLKEVYHEASEGSYRSNGASFSYNNRFLCVPAETVLRSEHRTPKPYIRGTQSAIVVGPSGEEIYTDEYGRVKVQFYWDRLGGGNESSSCWIRVAQFWAGKKWGAQFLPRIGHEVLVSFHEGDPDRPLIIGSVYNAENMPTYDLPANKAHSGIKSRSTKSGTTENFNEIRFEDEKGNELFYLHAEKDETEIVENDQTVEIGNDQKITVGHDSTESIGNDLNQTVGNNTTLSTAKDHEESIGENMTLDVGSDRSINVEGDHTETIGKGMSLEVGKDLKETVKGSHSESVTKDYDVTAKTIQLTAKSSITIKCGSAKITMKSSGEISVSGSKINLKASGNVTMKGSQILQN
ncbi:type VI secretion system export protein [Oleiphilus messinensis]|uniref:Type VI secretion system export protein n=1 Tax=Oleiphilus messinensis TaxID=141451 RepID=A0A1Y0IHH7_9GAMM|nr:type VI secretion system tip protein VgrG [Oleiphilus messinensis]ARU58834.1 type VI secretion system export protein [Oleiphilus messinensis]